MTGRRVQAAIHEAGHAVAHHVHKDVIRRIQIAEDGTGSTKARYRAPGRPSVTSALTCLAGAAAESRLLGGGYAASCKQDIEAARRHLKGTGVRVEDVWPQALQLVDAHRDNSAGRTAVDVARRA